jgi:hypothetical protein
VPVTCDGAPVATSQPDPNTISFPTTAGKTYSIQSSGT